MIENAWLTRGPLARLLWPLSQFYGAVSAIRRLLYRRGVLSIEHVRVPLIVVGNVLAGGVGKTPAVIAIVQHLQARGLTVGVVSRGYGRATQDCREVLPGSDPSDVGDEPALLQRATGAPVVVARRRIEAARALLARHPTTQVIVSDDGLQHLAMARDIEICVFDDRGVGNGWLLPAGPLREAWPRPCDLVLHTGQRPAFAGFTARRALASHALGNDGRSVPFSTFAGRPVIAVAAIGRPQAFFDMLRAAGLAIDQQIALPDHDDFSRWTPPPVPGAVLLCTEKDAVKLWRHAPDALAVPLQFTPEPAFLAALDAKLSSNDGHQAA